METYVVAPRMRSSRRDGVVSTVRRVGVKRRCAIRTVGCHGTSLPILKAARSEDFIFFWTDL